MQIANRTQPVNRINSVNSGTGQVMAMNQQPAPVSTNRAVSSSLAECTVNRDKLAQAVVKYNNAHRNSPMRDLEIFSLLSEGYINELSDCPMGGQYTLSLDNRTHTARISCSSHR